jgi:hypothetical protein
MLKLTGAALAALFLAAALQAQTTTTFAIGPYGCVHIDQCIIYAPGEAASLWEANVMGYVLKNGVYTQGYVSDQAIFNLYAWSPTSFTVLGTYRCTPTGDPTIASQDRIVTTLPTQAGHLADIQLDGTCHSAEQIDANGNVIATLAGMSYTFVAYEYRVRVGSGKGGGGVGNRWYVTSGSVTLSFL